MRVVSEPAIRDYTRRAACRVCRNDMGTRAQRIAQTYIEAMGIDERLCDAHWLTPEAQGSFLERLLRLEFS
jgi:hypothetical protein